MQITEECVSGPEPSRVPELLPCHSFHRGTAAVTSPVHSPSFAVLPGRWDILNPSGECFCFLCRACQRPPGYWSGSDRLFSGGTRSFSGRAHSRPRTRSCLSGKRHSRQDTPFHPDRAEAGLIACSLPAKGLLFSLLSLHPSLQAVEAIFKSP